MKTIIVTGGGTAGHINPAIDIAKKYIEFGYNVIYVGNSGNMEERLISKQENIKFEDISSPKLNRKKFLDNASFIFKYYKSYKKSKEIIKKYKPELIFATGGYVCVPICKAAERAKIKYYLHEQNAIAGLANKYLSKKAKCVFTSFPNTTGFRNSTACVFTGNPRTQIVFESKEKNVIRKNGRILVVSGSLGSEIINNTVIEMVNEFTDLKVDIITGEKYYDEIKGKVTSKNVNLLPYVDNLSNKLFEYNSIIARSGATTLAELTAVGVKTILIPSPNVVKNHQLFNAQEYSKIIETKIMSEEQISYRKLANDIYNYLTINNSIAEIRDKDVYEKSIKSLNNIIEEMEGKKFEKV